MELNVHPFFVWVQEATWKWRHRITGNIPQPVNLIWRMWFESQKKKMKGNLELQVKSKVRILAGLKKRQEQQQENCTFTQE